MGQQLSAAVVELFKKWVVRFPVPTDVPGPAHEERIRKYVIRFAEQVEFSFPGEGYGVKKASAGRPIGKDTLARKYGGAFLAWDLFKGAGTGTPEPDWTPTVHDLTDSKQVFVPVKPVNHLGVSEPGPDPTPEPKPDPKPPTPKPPTGPAFTHPDQLRVGREVGKILWAPGSKYAGNVDGAFESLAHILWKFRENPRYTIADALENARRRAAGLPAD